MPHLVEVDGDQSLAIIRARARQAVALDDGARGLARDAEALGDLGVGELLDRHGVSAWTKAARVWLPVS
jgi:hypothetical protein